MLYRLSDGTQVWIRPIRPDDKAELQYGLKRLSMDTIHKRFLSAKPRLSSAELRYLTEVDGVNHIALVAVSVLTGRIAGVARCVRLPDDADTAEWAIVVADELQGLGLGTKLIQLLADRARANGIRHFTATMLGDNLPARRLLSHAGAVLEREEVHGGLREVVVALAA
ncbi:MAG TPA: GNAT family N-acetyltransferase [Solirubrobacteraceae bacterium]|nr:GNAT family N-acetyltransferase [Solirubrobacteraceae bacterium]